MAASRPGCDECAGADSGPRTVARPGGEEKDHDPDAKKGS
eukprot:gene16569-47414_t